MARSHSVWVVFRHDSSGAPKIPPHTFTVKHECKTWYDKQPFPESLRVWRCPDGIRLHPRNVGPGQFNWEWDEEEPQEVTSEFRG